MTALYTCTPCNICKFSRLLDVSAPFGRCSRVTHCRARAAPLLLLLLPLLLLPLHRQRLAKCMNNTAEKKVSAYTIAYSYL
jgi:hypothetical protein